MRKKVRAFAIGILVTLVSLALWALIVAHILVVDNDSPLRTQIVVDVLSVGCSIYLGVKAAKRSLRRHEEGQDLDAPSHLGGLD